MANFEWRKANGGALALALALALSACAVPQIAKRDPVGAALFTLRVGYESAVREAGRAYQSGDLSPEKMGEVVMAAEKFYDAYQVAVAAHYLGQVSEASDRLPAIQELFAQLERLVDKYARKKI